MNNAMFLATVITAATVSLIVMEETHKEEAFEQWKSDYGSNFAVGE